MKLNSLSSISQKSKKRLGRGHGSGKVKTAGRGTKGQKAKGNIKPGFEGGQVTLRHRLPLLRGKGRNSSQKVAIAAIPLSRLTAYKNGETVSIATLQQKGLLDHGYTRAKLIGNTSLEVALTVTVLATKGATQSIQKAGGTISV